MPTTTTLNSFYAASTQVANWWNTRAAKTTPEVELWRAFIDRRAQDALAPLFLAGGSTSTDMKSTDIYYARAFFRGSSREHRNDFEATCDCADAIPSKVRSIMLPAIEAIEAIEREYRAAVQPSREMRAELIERARSIAA
jgi:hypothetical protein